MNEEMEDTLRHIHLERECGTLCRLFDGDSIYINTGSSNSRQEIEQSSLAIGGFMQVHNSWPLHCLYSFLFMMVLWLQEKVALDFEALQK